MPLLARMLPAPIVVDVRRGAIGTLGALLADRRIATEGRVAVAVGPRQADRITSVLDLGAGELFRVPDADTVARAVSVPAAEGSAGRSCWSWRARGRRCP